LFRLSLGAQLLLTKSAAIAAGASAPQPLRRQFLTGAASNITNPKIAVFYFAFLPQFVAHDAAQPMLTIMVSVVAVSAKKNHIKETIAVFTGRLQE